MMRAILLASATATTFFGFSSSIAALAPAERLDPDAHFQAIS